MKLNSSNPARSTATGTQKWTSVSTRSSRLEFAFGLSIVAIPTPGRRSAQAMPWPPRRRLVVFARGLRGGMFALVGFPGLLDDVSVNGVGLLDRQVGVGKGEFWRIGEAGHALRPMRAAHHDLIPVFMDFRRRVAQIRNGAVFHPGPAAVDARRVTALTIKRDVEFFAIANRLQAGFLSRRFRHRRNFDLRIGEWYAAAKLERIETRGTPLRFGRGHGARGREQARAGAPTHRSNDVLLTLRRKSHGNRVDRGLRLDGPEFFPGVG